MSVSFSGNSPVLRMECTSVEGDDSMDAATHSSDLAADDVVEGSSYSQQKPAHNSTLYGLDIKLHHQ